MTIKVSEILAEARDEIARGWCQGKGEDEQGNVCMIGALAHVQARLMFEQPYFDIHSLKTYPYWALMDTIREQYGEDTYIAVPQFNDAKTTTKQDVLNIFDKTIAGLEEKGL